MQSKVIDVPLSSNDVYNIIENDVWKRLGFNLFLSNFEQCYNVCVEVGIQKFSQRYQKKTFQRWHVNL